MEALEALLNSLKKREFKSFEEANTQLQEVLKLKDAVVAFEKESLIKIVPATFAKTQQFVTAAKNDLKKLESDASNIVKKALDGLFSDVKGPLTNANQMHFHDRYAEASESLNKARNALAVLDAAPYNFADAVKTFVTESRAQIDTIEKKIADSMMGRVVDDKIREAKTHGSKAKDMLFQDRYQESLDAVAKARESIAQLSETPYSTHSAVAAFLPTFITQVDEYEKKCGEKMYGRIVDDKIRAANTHGDKAKDMLFQNRYQESLDAIAKARDAIAELSSAPFDTFPAVTNFLPKFIARIDEYETKCGEEMFGRVIDEKIRAANTHGDKAKDMHYQSRFQEALDAIAKAREAISDLQSTFGTHKTVVDFLAKFIPKIDDLEKSCGEQMYGRIVDDKIRAAKTHGSTAKDMNYHSRFKEALEAVTKARESIAELSNAPFNTFAEVVKFLPDFITLIDQYEKQSSEGMYSRLVDDKIREAKTHGSKAKDMLFHNRYQESLDAVAKARELIVELSNPPYAEFKAVVEFLPAFVTQINEYEKKCGEEMFGRVVDEKIRLAKTHGSTAKDMHYQSRYQESLDAVAKAREVIAELDQTPYNGFKAVVEFLPAFVKQIDEYEKQCGEKMFSRVAEEKIRQATTHGSTAKDMHYQSRFQESLDAVAKAREQINELAQPPYVNLDIVKTFLNNFVKQIDDLEMKCGESMFARLADDKIRAAKTHGSTAKDMHYQSRFQESLDAVAKAREVIAELQEAPWNSLQDVASFLPAFVKQIDEYETQCGEALFSRVVEEKIRAAKTHGSTAKDMHYQSRFQEALDAATKAREIIAELKEVPYNSLKLTTEFLPEFEKQIDQYETQCGEALFSRVVEEKIRAAKTHASTAKDMHYQSRFQEALDAVTKAREVITELKEVPYNSLKLTMEFLPEFEKQIDQYERQCGEAMFGRVVEDKIRAVKTIVTEAEHLHKHSRNEEALTSIDKARGAIAEIEQPPYATLEATVAYLKDAKPALDALEGKIAEVLFGRVVEDKIRAANTHISTAKDLNFHSRNSEALAAVAKAREVIAELTETPYNTITITVAFLKDTVPALDQLEAKIGEAMFGRVVYDKIYAGKSHVSTAKNFVDHSRHQEALDALNKAYDSLAELENPPYNTLPLVVSYVAETRTTLDSLERTITAAMGGAAATGAESGPVVKSVPNAPGFPDGPVSDTVGPWVIHVASPFTSLQAQADTAGKTRTFLIQWNTSILTINGEWRKAVNELIRDAKNAEYVVPGEPYHPPKYIAGKWDHTLSLLEKLEKQVQEIPEDEKDTVRKTMWDQVNTAFNYIAENMDRETLVEEFVKVLEKASMLYCRIVNEVGASRRNLADFADEIASELHSLNMKFPNIPPYQAELTKIISEKEHTGKVSKILSLIESVIVSVNARAPYHTQEPILEVLKQLEKWPVARRFFIYRLTRILDSEFRFHPQDRTPDLEPVWPTPTAPTDLWQPSEADFGMPDYEFVRPGTPAQSGLPFGNRPDSTKHEQFVKFTAPYAGKIVFSTGEIPLLIDQKKDALQTKFNLADQIVARAVWPRSLSNYAIGKKKNGAPVYTVDDHMDAPINCPNLVMSLQVKIDGKPVHPRHEFQQSIGYFTGDSKLFNTQQSVFFNVLGLSIDFADHSNSWSVKSRLLYSYLLRAGPGVHKVEMSLHYNVFESDARHQHRVDEPTNINTLTSHPLAEGSFEVDVPAGAKMPDDFGPTQIEPVPLRALEKFFFSDSEQFIWGAPTGDWSIHVPEQEIIEVVNAAFGEYRKVKIPAKYGKFYCCLSYIDPRNCDWKFEAAKYTIMQVIAGPKKSWEDGVESVGIARYGALFEVDSLPENLINAIPERCPPESRNI